MRLSLLVPALAAVAAIALFTSVPAGQAPQTRATRFDVLITSGRIVDGTGSPWFRGDIGIVGDRIAAGIACAPGDADVRVAMSAPIQIARAKNAAHIAAASRASPS